MTDKEAISNLNQIYGFVAPDIQRSLDLAIKALEKRTKGEWKYTHDTFSKRICNKCNYSQVIVDGMADNFCPNCGVDMRRSVEGQASRYNSYF